MPGMTGTRCVQCDELDLSVIVPTYERRAILGRCLEALFAQSLPSSQYEVLVIDDGSSDGTEALLERVEATAPLSLKSFQQAHQGPAAARNVGIDNARGRIILFIGDDIIASSDLLAQHLNWHREHPEETIAVLGYVSWALDIETTPFMKWLESGGPQFKYWAIEDREDVFFKHFYTANVSLKRDFVLRVGRFDEEFPYAAYEDTEFAYRLAANGMRLVFNDQAVGYHYHPVTLQDSLQRMRKVGEARVLYELKVGNASLHSSQSRHPVRKLASTAKFAFLRAIGCAIQERLSVAWLYSYLLDKAEWEGWRGANLDLAEGTCDD